jgi:hypothetical protein
MAAAAGNDDGRIGRIWRIGGHGRIGREWRIGGEWRVRCVMRAPLAAFAAATFGLALPILIVLRFLTALFLMLPLFVMMSVVIMVFVAMFAMFVNSVILTTFEFMLNSFRDGIQRLSSLAKNSLQMPQIQHIITLIDGPGRCMGG